MNPKSLLELRGGAHMVKPDRCAVAKQTSAAWASPRRTLTVLDRQWEWAVGAERAMNHMTPGDPAASVRMARPHRRG